MIKSLEKIIEFSDSKKARSSIYMGFRLETYSDNWHFKDSVKTKIREPQYVI
jgi:hypothetical protein